MAVRALQNPHSLRSARVFTNQHVAKLVHPGRRRTLRPGFQGRRCRFAVVSAANLADIPPELPDYDMVQLGSMEVSALALDCSTWDNSDPSAFVAAVDGGITLYDTHPNEMLLGSYVNAWCVSEAASLPGARPPILASTCHIRLDGSSPLTQQQVFAALAAHKADTRGVGGTGLCQLALDCPPEALLD
eukprot:CAMPEP_0118927154 /NCGR_PEP_ID=MMETSP1169-20130426/4689_1 /TAXON_ID=36882 /ORGANISM="Pyramimonas obovata, Strain CCMP722" /LENGTH=187 /DNA_ID=CAMNT_0006868859 /DNA_START=215 /DNA_END=775 /DNA_ORIENTATION=-